MNAYDLLQRELKNGSVARVYLFWGKESYIRERALLLLKNKLLTPENTPFNFDLLEGEETGEQAIVSMAQTPPLLGKWRLVAVKDPPFLKSEAQDAGKKGEVLMDYIKNPAPNTCLVFTTGAPVDRRRAMVKLLEKSHRVLEFTSPSASELAEWVRKKVRREGFAISQPAVEMLLNNAGSLQSLAGELEKCFLYAWDDKKIDGETINAVVTKSMEENIFAVMDALGQGELSRALAGIEDLLALKEPPQLILAMVARQFRLMVQATECARAGEDLKELAARLKMQPFVLRKALDQGKRFAPGVPAHALAGLADLDYGIKSGRQEFYPALYDFLLRLAVLPKDSQLTRRS